jgi:hypothetical protein
MSFSTWRMRAAGLLLAVSSTTALASQDFYYLGTVYGPSGVVGTYREPLSSALYKPMADAQKTFMNQLRGLLVPELLNLVATVPGYQGGSASVSGPVTLKYQSGFVTFTGLRASVSATASQSYAGVNVTCNVNVSLSPATEFVGRLDIVSGQLQPTELRNFRLDPSYSCQTNLDWIPLVNVLVDTIISRQLDSLIAAKLAQAYGAVAAVSQAQPLSFMGLNAIPDQLFGVAGVQLAQLKSAIAAGFVSLPEMTVDIGDPKRLVFGPQGYPHEAASHDLIMSIAIGNVRFELGEHRVYYDEMYCPPQSSGRACFPF